MDPMFCLKIIVTSLCGDGIYKGGGQREDLPGTLMMRQGSCCALDDICGGRVGGLQKMEGGKEFEGAAKSVGPLLPVRKNARAFLPLLPAIEIRSFQHLQSVVVPTEECERGIEKAHHPPPPRLSLTRMLLARALDRV